MVAEMTVDASRETAAEPAPGTDERKLVRGAVVAVSLLAVPAAAIAYASAGWHAAASALLGLGFVLVMFGGSAMLLVRAAERRDNGIAPMVVGVLLRLPLYLVALAGLSQLSWVHGRALALATAVAVAITLAYELRLIARSPRMFWIDPEAHASSVSDATRS
jgi:hypothetical protein